MDTSPESRSLSQHLRGVLVGRSICPQCGQKIAWRDNLPLLSFVLLGGQCRHCQKKISLHYPLGELITGLLFLAVYQYFKTGPLLLTVYYLLLTASLVAVALSDFLYQTIPDEIVWPGMVLAVLFQFFHLAGVEVVASTPPRWPNGLLGGGMAGSLFLSLVWLTRGRGMGWGDVKLAGLMGLFLGYPQIIVALYIAFLTGALMGVILIMLKKKRFGEQIPFGPFLVGSTIVTLFYGEQIKNLAFGIWHF